MTPVRGRPAICRDPARREEFLALVRAQPRIRVVDLAALMGLSNSTIHNLVAVFEREGKVASEIDKTARRISKSCAPKVVWLVTRRAPRIGKPKIPQGVGFRYPERELFYPYAPTGTLAPDASRVQCVAIAGQAR